MLSPPIRHSGYYTSFFLLSDVWARTDAQSVCAELCVNLLTTRQPAAPADWHKWRQGVICELSSSDRKRLTTSHYDCMSVNLGVVITGWFPDYMLCYYTSLRVSREVTDQCLLCACTHVCVLVRLCLCVCESEVEVSLFTRAELSYQCGYVGKQTLFILGGCASKRVSVFLVCRVAIKLAALCEYVWVSQPRSGMRKRHLGAAHCWLSALSV